MKKILIAIAAAALIIAALLLLKAPSEQRKVAPAAPSAPVAAPEAAAPVGADTSARINQDIESLKVNDLDQDFKEIDKNLNQL